MNFNAMAVVIFDIWGDFGLFRKFYTNTSMLTYAFPPPTAVKGIVGAILGLRKNEYISVLKNFECAVAIKNPVRKIRTTLNYINTKDRNFSLEAGRTQIPCEIVRDAYYRIYVKGLNQDLEEKFVYYLQNHKSYFVPYLGMSEFIANFKFISKSEDIKKHGEADVDSVVHLAKAVPIIQHGLKLAKERIPKDISEDRAVLEYIDVVYNESAEPIRIKGDYSQINDVNVVFM